ncbi:PREDICTED: uncharacterized protein LOC105587099 [Cercocebus atys]|uniref:uncharacterized protein LOC105587099 n=1 Tax=Cercocebus atys TaxID=9531 RepID=UPI0005F474C1|nr:PREDICTED: uncharacterized protein LOC105587099 [Cercocebus atys]
MDNPGFHTQQRFSSQTRPMPQRGRSDSSWPAEGASRHLATGRLGRASSCRPLPRLFPSGEVGKVEAAAAVVPAAPVGVSRQPAYRSARAASSPVQPSRCGRVRPRSGSRRRST